MITLDPQGSLARARFYVAYSCAIVVALLIGSSTFYGLSSASVIWPAAGVFGGFLVITARRHWVIMIVLLVLLDQAVSNAIRGFPGREGLITLGVKVVYNPATGVVFALIVQRWLTDRDPIANPRALSIYVFFGIIANLVIASLVTWSIAGLIVDEIRVIAKWQQWAYSGISGQLAYATPIIVIANRWDTIRTIRERFFEGLLYIVGFLGVCFYLFAYEHSNAAIQPYQVLLMVPLFVWVIARFGPVMLTLSAGALITIIMVGMSLGRGPFDVDTRAEETNVLIAQGVMVPGMFTLLFIASMLEGLRRQYKFQLDTEQQLRRLDRVQSLGTMASGVAHDFGNLVIALGAYQSILRSQIRDPSEPVRNALKGIEEIANGAQALTGALMTFAREESSEHKDQPVVSDLCQAVHSVRQTLNPMYEKKYGLEVRLPEGQILVGMRQSDLRRILSNLIINAFDASAPGERVVVKVFTKDRTARLIVADHGEGIPDTIRERIFDPFFTTKARGEGTGLGLAIVSGVVRDAGGKLDVDSAPGVGTTITVTLPIAQAEGSTDTGR